MTVSISASVGRGGVNRAADVRKMKQLLNHIFPADPLELDGEANAMLVRRIERFQRRFLNEPDGRIDPGGRTLERLNESAPAAQSDWSGDSSRWPQEKKLRSLAPEMRDPVSRTLERLQEEGFRPNIFYAWRSVQVQRRLVEEGNSRVSFSFHNAQKPDGTPNAYAADIIDKRWGWDDAAERNGFWSALGRIAKGEGLRWGGDWRSFRDVAHVQLFPNGQLVQVKRDSGLA
jgi:hypothetical protein